MTPGHSLAMKIPFFFFFLVDIFVDINVSRLLVQLLHLRKFAGSAIFSYFIKAF